MNHKIMYIATGFIIGLFIIFLSVGIGLSISINVNDELVKITQKTEINNIVFDKVSELNNFNFLIFIFSFEGFSNVHLIHGNNIAFTIILVLFLIPSLGIVSLLFSMILIFNFISERIQREYKYVFMKNISKYTLYISLLAFTICILVGTILLGTVDAKLDIQIYKKLFYEKNNGWDVFDIISTSQILEGGLDKVLAGKFDVTTNLLGEFTLNKTTLSTGLSMILIGVPITAIFSLVSASSWIGTYISLQRGSISSFMNWLGNVRIDTMREFRASIKNNIWFLMLVIMFFATILFPGIIHKYETTASIIWTVSSILVAVIVFIPTYIGIHTVKKLQSFNYNLVMFIQLWILFIVIVLMNVLMFAMYKDILLSNSFVSVIYPILITITSSVCFLNFVREKK